MSVDDVEICTVDMSMPSRSRCTTVSVGASMDNHKYVKKYSAETLTKVGLISMKGDVHTVRLDESDNVVVTRSNKPVPVLRNSALKYNLIRLLRKYNTKFLQIEAI